MESRKIVEESEQFLATTTRDLPLVLDRGEGVWLYDVDGNKYLDFTSGIGVNNLGWPSHPEVIRVAEAQMNKLAHAMGNDFYNLPQLELAKRLVQLTPGDFPKKVFFSNSGTEAVEASLKLVRQYDPKRKYLIAFLGSFHGRTYGSLSLTASKPVQKYLLGPTLPGVIHVPYPNPFRNPWHIDGYEDPEGLTEAVLEYLESWIFSSLVDPEEVAGIVFEPIQGEGGYVVPPKGFFRKLERVARDNGIALIDDEVQMGMGRTGKMFAIENFDSTPDVITMAKALGGGLYPIGATVFRKELDFKKKGMHSNTFGGNAVACAVGVKTLEIVKELLPKVNEVGKVFRDELSLMKVDDVRGMGLAWGIEFVKGEKKDPDTKTRDKVIEGVFKKGLLVLPAGKSSIRVIPPLIISEEEAKLGLSVLREVVNSLR
ncbi:acetyl ornithine aminotransferase family protein [Stygiolobus caldivivus]|uniref:Aspartate aminotransferase family protein n=1 Tax=Stygiolobus caldivivus TaxID=2824673 RepID=A0A8D5U4C8_9CREN|nr:acetyl ornithine aminotransferase family protein [Stygiolobus caldivivus]BCU68706.1 aspartate aminotransferase family protein [Stygiolobus caldivivus]